jgi:hypothetical protein
MEMRERRTRLLISLPPVSLSLTISSGCGPGLFFRNIREHDSIHRCNLVKWKFSKDNRKSDAIQIYQPLKI